MISLIVAHDHNHVIGYENGMPWHLPGDLQYFKEKTMGKPMIMGRKTFESIGRPLPGRRNIVVTRDANYRADGIETATSIEEALALAGDVPEIMIIGGEQIFRLSMELTDRIYITKINHAFKGDTFFPAYEEEFVLVASQEPETAPEGYTFQYQIFERRQ
ncbi:dihydrofolate reductase [Lysinibacillus sphaericus]|uniref:Dihydrofolate reductase n=2 Tax=Lysinibacillus TaxID=400634 RepID=A0A2S0K0M4_LYSSH|nr:MULTISPECIES: dihydrofolate reductase [Lysinibacillus]AVK96794.1 dihydrofolate reductase [Lysinibacillus sphaericus]MED4545743.1 dihydrofolate reductase [Lysinibacillus sphaericus]TKI16696.1 dihydrofolate reductase [Lysinibacillus sphaericus]TKI47193.1 dihydrofolate reductase [Lysinibacillus tabacifolii]SUV17384.1 dihydrofolate reductase [Lysinibacillus sphaericus]